MSLEERLEKAEKLVAEVKAELAAMRATKRNWPERIEAGMVFGISEGGMECQYIVSDASRLVCIASNTPGMIGGKWNSESLFRGSEDRFAYLGHARDILTIRTDAHEPTGAELVGRVCEFSDDGENWTDGARPREQGDPRICIGYDGKSDRPYSNRWAEWKLARLAK